MYSMGIPAEVAAKLDALSTAVAAFGELNFGSLEAPVRLHVLEQLETARRRQIAVGHDVIAGLAKEDPADVGGPVHKVVADWLRISCAEACRRLRDAKQLSPRLTLTARSCHQSCRPPPRYGAMGCSMGSTCE
jgi:hypothetical protein